MQRHIYIKKKNSKHLAIMAQLKLLLELLIFGNLATWQLTFSNSAIYLLATYLLATDPTVIHPTVITQS